MKRDIRMLVSHGVETLLKSSVSDTPQKCDTVLILVEQRHCETTLELLSQSLKTNLNRIQK